MKRILMLMMLCLSVMTLCSGCVAIINCEPLSQKNEFKDEQLPGLWMGIDKHKEAAFFYIEDKGDYYLVKTLSLMPECKLTLSKVTSSDNKTNMNFFNVDISRGFDKSQLKRYLILRYQITEKNIRLLNIKAKDREFEKVLKAMNRADEKADWLDIPAGELRKVFAKYSNNFEALKINFTKVDFKDQQARELFCAVSEFISEYLFMLSNAVDYKTPDNIRSEIKKTMDDRLLQWRKQNSKYLTASFNQKLDAFLIKLDKCFAQKKYEDVKEARTVIKDFTNELNDMCQKELIKH